MPRALTIEEKRDRANATLAALATPAVAPVTPAADGATRRKKGTFNGTQGKLKVEGTIPGYHLHILNDDRNRLQEAQDNGYEFVTPSEIKGVSENVTSRNGDIGDSRVRFLVGTQENGQPLHGYLMKIRQEWYDEDQADLQRKNDQIDESVRKGAVNGNNPHFYVPQGGIKLS